MPVAPLRRISAPTSLGLYDRLVREALHSAWSRGEVDPIAHEHPELIIARDGNLLTAFGSESARIAYSFVDERAFIDLFPAMFARLLPLMRRTLGASSVSFRLTHNSVRPVVEPVLKRLSFEQKRSWLAFSLAKSAMPAKLPATAGIRFRDGTIADLELVVRLDHEAFPNTPMPTSALKAEIESGQEVLIAMAGREAAGMALYSRDEVDAPYLHTLAVGEQYRRQGIGGALTARVAKRAFAGGASRLDLRTDEDNGAAIKLYVGMGFRPSGAGRDYERLTDDKAIARLRKANEGTLIRFGGWR